MARGIQFLCAAMVFALLGAVLFASKPTTKMLAVLAPQSEGTGERLVGKSTLLAQNDGNKAADPLDDLFQTDNKPANNNANNGNDNNNGKGKGKGRGNQNGNGNGNNGNGNGNNGNGNGGNGNGNGSTMIGALRKLFGDLNDTDLDGFDRDEGTRILDSAEAELQRQKEINARDILRANRQLRLRNCEKVNVLVIMLDDVGFGELGAYGQQMIATPYIDQFAQKCVRFTQFYAGSSQDISSRGTYLSARHTGRGELHGEEWITVRKSDFTLPKVMYQGGFDTGFMGKWCMGDTRFAGKPNEQGIAHFFGYLTPDEAENMYPEFLWRNTAKVEIEANKNGNRGGYSPELITTEAIKFLKDHSYYRDATDRELESVLPSERARHRNGLIVPFFLTVSYSMPITAAGADVPSDSPYSATNWPQPKKNYASMITTVDALVGKIFQALERYDLQERTIVILTSDNGPRTNDVVDTEFFETTGQLRGQQVDLFEGAIRVPMLIYQPSRGERGGFDSKRIWAMWDLPVTIAQLANCIRRPQQVDGRPQTDSLDEWAYELAESAKVKTGDDMLYWEVRNGDIAQAVRLGNWKALRTGPKGKWQLYNLKTDLAEQKDIASEHPDIVSTIDSFATKSQGPPGLARVGEEE